MLRMPRGCVPVVMRSMTYLPCRHAEHDGPVVMRSSPSAAVMSRQSFRRDADRTMASMDFFPRVLVLAVLASGRGPNAQTVT